jgi:hypothetical protein
MGAEMKRPFTLNLEPNQVAMISECDGAFVIEPMRFLWPSEARREARGRSYDQLPWCPQEYRAEYRKLRRMGLRASEARPLVEDNMARDVIHSRSSNVPDIVQTRSRSDNQR